MVSGVRRERALADPAVAPPLLRELTDVQVDEVTRLLARLLIDARERREQAA